MENFFSTIHPDLLSMIASCLGVISFLVMLMIIRFGLRQLVSLLNNHTGHKYISDYEEDEEEYKERL